MSLYDCRITPRKLLDLITYLIGHSLLEDVITLVGNLLDDLPLIGDRQRAGQSSRRSRRTGSTDDAQDLRQTIRACSICLAMQPKKRTARLRRARSANEVA